MKGLWRLLKDTVRYSDGIMTVRHKEYHYAPVGESMPFTVLDMSDWVTIVPETPSGGFLIVRQFRAGNGEDTLEFPGGGVNKGEDILAAAARELAEETGAEATEIIHLGTMEPNPAFMSNKCHVFLAKGSVIKHGTMPDKFEDVEAIEVTSEKMSEMIARGEFRQSISLAAFSLFLNSGK